MAVEIIYKLICNDCKRFRLYEQAGNCGMRQRAKIDGWSYVTGYGLPIDFCPACTVKKQQKKKAVS